MPSFLIRLLGSPSVEGPDGILQGAAVQRHRLAVVALLAVAPRQSLSRERLMSLLWPEASTGNARNLLNAAVHSIRRALGEDVLLTQGGGIVLDPAKVRVDVLEFEAALHGGDPIRAIDLYSGPFLDGLGLPDALEFERWQESERDRLEELFRTALEHVALAVGRENGPAAAVQWWRRRVACTPLDARVTMRLMETLAAAGDRGEALRVAATHAQLMDAEFGVTPDSGVTELAERLSRLPADRLAHAADFPAASIPIRDPAVPAREVPTPAAASGLPGPPGLRRLSPGWVGVAVIAIFAGAVGVQLTKSPEASGELVYFKFDVPAQQLWGGIFSRFALSPDGKSLVYAGADHRLYVRRMESPDVIALRGSEGALAPSFSPDGQWLVYSQADAVKKQAIQEGSSVTIVRQHSRIGTSWSRDGTNILLASEAPGAFLRRVSAEGGEILRITSSSDSVPTQNYAWPQALPGGDAVLFTAIGLSGTAADSRVVLLDLRTGESHVVVSRAMHGRYIRSGESEYLLYALSDGTVLAAPFDLRGRRVTGPAFAAVSDVQVAVFNGAALFAVAENGTLAFVRGSSTNLQLLKWVDRTGRELSTIGPPLTTTGSEPPLTLSPDGGRVALTRRTPANNNLWLLETTTGQLERLTFGSNEDETAVWSPDGRSVAYASTRENGVTWVYSQSVEGPSHPRHIYSARNHGHLSSWSPDGRWLLFNSLSDSILALRSDGKESRTVVADADVGAGSGQFSPDGRWIAFTSDQTGRSEVYVISFPQLTGKRQVSLEGGTIPRWAPDGSALFYRQGRRLMAVPVSLRPYLTLGTAGVLFEADFMSFEVAPDGQRFLLLTYNPEANRGEIHVVLNWFRELEERAKAAGS